MSRQQKKLSVEALESRLAPARIGNLPFDPPDLTSQGSPQSADRFEALPGFNGGVFIG